MEHAETNGGIRTDWRWQQTGRVGRACVSILRVGRHVAGFIACAPGSSFTPRYPPPSM